MSLTLPPIDKGMSLEALRAELVGLDAQFSEIRFRPQELMFVEEGIPYNGGTIIVDERLRKQLFHRLGCPWGYWENHSPAFQAVALSEDALRGHLGLHPTLILANDRPLTIARGDLNALHYSAVFTAVGETLETQLYVARIGCDDTRLDVDLVSRDRAIDVRPGDVVQSGLHIVHDRFGDEPTIIEAFIYRLRCSNGLIHRQAVGHERFRTRRLKIDAPNGTELQIAQVRRLTQHTWNGLQKQLSALQKTNERRVDAMGLMRSWFAQARLSWTNMEPRLRDAWRDEGEEQTVWGVVNALTRVATHGENLTIRQRRVLASLAGMLAFAEAHLCEKCWSVMRRSAAHFRKAA